MPSAFCRHGLSPSDAATSSPSWSRLRPRVLIAASRSPSARNGSTSQKTDIGRPGHRAHHPEPVGVEGLRVADHDRLGDRKKQGAHGRAGQHEGDRVGAAAAGADREDGCRGDAGASKSEPRRSWSGRRRRACRSQGPPRTTRRPRRRAAQGRPAGCGCGPASGRRPHPVRCRSRSRARCAGRAARARSSRPPTVVVEEHLDDRAEGDRAAPQGQAEQRHHTEREDQERQPAHRAAA